MESSSGDTEVSISDSFFILIMRIVAWILQTGTNLVGMINIV